MTYIEKIAFHLDRRDEVPNQQLAFLLAEEENHAGIAEIAGYLNDTNKSIQSDCLKVLYEIGYIAPQLITKYSSSFIDQLDSKNNRMVWGSMIALSTIAQLVPEDIRPQREKIIRLIETGSVITNVWGVKTLINLSKTGEKIYTELVDDLFRFQKECRNVDFAKRAEEMEPAIRPDHRSAYRKLLETRLPKLSKTAQVRLKKVISKLE